MGMNKQLAILLGLASALVVGCGGHSSIPANPSSAAAGTPEYKAALDLAKVTRLATAATTTSAVVSGSIKLNGLTPLDDGGNPVPIAGGSTFAWIVNPGDDILSAQYKTNPDAQGNFTLTIPNPPTRAIVAINFKVQNDLNGDGTGSDIISQRFAVALAPAKR